MYLYIIVGQTEHFYSCIIKKTYIHDEGRKKNAPCLTDIGEKEVCQTD